MYYADTTRLGHCNHQSKCEGKIRVHNFIEEGMDGKDKIHSVGIREMGGVIQGC